MKKFINNITKASLMGVAFLLSSCLEDTGYLDIYNGVNADIPVVSMGQSEYGFNVKTVEIMPGFQDITVPINIARAKSGNTNVTIALNPALLDAYNAAEQAAAIEAGHGEDFVPYELPPDGTYQLPTTTVTIPSGQLDTDFVIEVNSENLDLTEKYMIPLEITSADNGAVVASNLNTSLVAVVVKNKYDGHYDLMTSMTGWGAFGIDENNLREYPDGVDLITAGANQVTMYNPYFGADLLPGFSGGAATAFGATSPIFTFDANDNLIAVANTYPPDTRNRTLSINPAAPANHNVFDPVAKTLIADFIFRQTGRPDNFVIMDMTFANARP